MKKIFAVIVTVLCVIFTFALVACNGNEEVPPIGADDKRPAYDGTKTLVVYFTAESGNTERVANYIHNQIGGDIVKIEAAQPYTSQDLNYSIPNNRPEVEKAENARPEIAQSTYDQIDMSKYDAVFIGYPIWWWTAPMIVGTFLEHYDLTGYDIYPFSQSASMNVTQFNTSMEFVRECAAKEGRTPTVHDGLFARATSTATINAYLTANGFLSAKYNAETKFDSNKDYRREMPQFQKEAYGQNAELVGLLKNIATKRNTTTAQIALAWLIGKKPYIVPIPGTTKSERMKENAKAAEVLLTEKEISEIDAALNTMKMSAVFDGHKFGG